LNFWFDSQKCKMQIMAIFLNHLLRLVQRESTLHDLKYFKMAKQSIELLKENRTFPPADVFHLQDLLQCGSSPSRAQSQSTDSYMTTVNPVLPAFIAYEETGDNKRLFETLRILGSGWRHRAADIHEITNMLERLCHVKNHLLPEFVVDRLVMLCYSENPLVHSLRNCFRLYQQEGQWVRFWRGLWIIIKGILSFITPQDTLLLTIQEMWNMSLLSNIERHYLQQLVVKNDPEMIQAYSFWLETTDIQQLYNLLINIGNNWKVTLGPNEKSFFDKYYNLFVQKKLKKEEWRQFQEAIYKRDVNLLQKLDELLIK